MFFGNFLTISFHKRETKPYLDSHDGLLTFHTNLASFMPLTNNGITLIKAVRQQKFSKLACPSSPPKEQDRVSLEQFVVKSKNRIQTGKSPLQTYVAAIFS